MSEAESAAAGLLFEIREFLSRFKRDLPEVFSPPPAGGDRRVFEERVSYWGALMGLKPNRIFVKEQRSLWGSCSARGNLNFNRRLLQAPAEVLDYVVIHELAHLKEMNHSRSFWALVQAWCPRHKEHRRWLRLNAGLLRPRRRRGPVS